MKRRPQRADRSPPRRAAGATPRRRADATPPPPRGHRARDEPIATPPEPAALLGVARDPRDEAPPPSARTRPPAAPQSEVLFHDDQLVVVNKAAGDHSTPGRGAAAALPELIARRLGLTDISRLRVVHRLDRGASGVMLLARTLGAQQALVRQFMERTIEKVYVAIVSGYVIADGEVNMPITYDTGRGVSKIAPSRGKEALTHYRIVERIAGNTVLECRPVTGRRHQIRVHLAAIGHPLSVDPTYGGATALSLSSYKSNYRVSTRHPEWPLIDRLTLHARTITFDHPTSGARLTFEAPLPKDLRATIQQLGRIVRPS